MSSELRELLTQVATEDEKREQTKFEERINRYKALLLKVDKEKKLDAITSFEGTDYPNQMAADLKVLEKAQLLNGQTKYTHRNAYREYTLSVKGADLVEKLSKES